MEINVLLSTILFGISLNVMEVKSSVNHLEAHSRLSKDERCIAWVLHNEARGEPLNGARAVMDVILERMKSRGKTACEVISEKGQFPGYSKNYSRNISHEVLTRYKIVSRIAPVVKGCSYFHAKRVAPKWRSKMKICGAIGNHIFYKEKT